MLGNQLTQCVTNYQIITMCLVNKLINYEVGCGPEGTYFKTWLGLLSYVVNML